MVRRRRCLNEGGVAAPPLDSPANSASCDLSISTNSARLVSGEGELRGRTSTSRRARGRGPCGHGPRGARPGPAGRGPSSARTRVINHAVLVQVVAGDELTCFSLRHLPAGAHRHSHLVRRQHPTPVLKGWVGWGWVGWGGGRTSAWSRLDAQPCHTPRPCSSIKAPLPPSTQPAGAPDPSSGKL